MFVLAGIPVYYVTHRTEQNMPRGLCTYISNRYEFSLLCSVMITAWIGSLLARVRGRPPAEDGWEAIATEGDEPIEMHEGHRTSSRR